MADLQSFHARVCYTAAALVVHEDKVLFIKHKKLGIWFAPGGHIEENELPHQAAARECFEETGIRVRIIDSHFSYDSSESEYVPSPFETNLHWVCEENYRARIADPKSYTPSPLWKRGCEQHIGFLYLAEPMDAVVVKRQQNEIDDIGWFTPDEVDRLKTNDDIRQEVRHAFRLLEKG